MFKPFLFSLLVAILPLSASGSGSDTVFAKFQNYYVSADMTQALSHPTISQFVEAEQVTEILVVKVSMEDYQTALELLNTTDSKVGVTLGNGEDLCFTWEPGYELFHGVDQNGQHYILSP
ncbi:hypothetical protein [Pseudobacteriovorax antillogorgiicola]|uniref:Uncharacterized protein n=1 Tax=Pseudobacteriovorax antillogorgiicola TaxID=1513793 RepID=A0A1Y6C749_9BACT|nr:hypothetical protein [Pseudobacteriovorax antillogorgiicola]TCS49358.1 hypothetical protein EDD56_11538 [Pseudobacteriovorax antillogorgiicola]SMF47555.1 hypothetical protein SAMN06296036_114146 [Pseudobacteriovorax antillogorgiicola]